MRARWAISAAGVDVAQHEVALRDKPAALLAASPKGTVPVLVLPGDRVIDQSLDIMRWALQQHDPQGWLTPEQGSLPDMLALIDACERDFKPHLDRYKYPVRFRHEWAAGPSDGVGGAPGVATAEQVFSDQHFDVAAAFLQALSIPLARHRGAAYLGGTRPALADFAIVPFVRQMARHDAPRFEQAVPASVLAWAGTLLARPDFQALMQKTG